MSLHAASSLPSSTWRESSADMSIVLGKCPTLSLEVFRHQPPHPQ
jgi:hypothetical protein